MENKTLTPMAQLIVFIEKVSEINGFSPLTVSIIYEKAAELLEEEKKHLEKAWSWDCTDWMKIDNFDQYFKSVYNENKI
jgi:hypothetical protein